VLILFIFSKPIATALVWLLAAAENILSETYLA
jgi:hypothetical protein